MAKTVRYWFHERWHFNAITNSDSAKTRIYEWHLSLKQKSIDPDLITDKKILTMPIPEEIQQDYSELSDYIEAINSEFVEEDSEDLGEILNLKYEY